MAGLLLAVMCLGVAGALVWLGRTYLPSIPGLFTNQTVTPTTSATITPTRNPNTSLTNTPDPRIMNPANQHFYLYINQGRDWDDARDYCLEQGGHLVTIQDDAENKFVYDLTKGYTWLGASNEDSHRIWVWVTGESWKYSKWQSGEPTSDRYKNEITYARDLPYVWKTIDGYFISMPFVCEWDYAP